MKKTGIAIAVLLAVGGVAVGGAWYSGEKIEGVLRDSIAKGNAELNELLPDENIQLELVSFERGFFSSNARYRITWDEADASGAKPEVLVQDKLEHGPFPLSRVMRLKLLPVMAVSNGELVRNELLEPLFKMVPEGAKPIVSSSVIGYDRSVSGDLTFSPFSYSNADSKIDFSGLGLNYYTNNDASNIQVAGEIEKISLEDVGNPQQRVEFQGLRLESDRTLGASGFYNGTGTFSVGRVSAQLGEGSTLELRGIEQRDQTAEDAKSLAGKLAYKVAAIEYNGQLLGSATMDWSIADFDVVALKQLSDSYDEWALRLQENPNAELTAAEEQLLENGVMALLAGHPKIALDDFTLKTANGQGSLSLKLGFNKPESFELPPQVLWQQLLASLDLALGVDKEMIADVLAYQALLDATADKQEAALQAKMMAEMAAEMAVAMQLATLEGSKLLSTLNYANGQVNFNGKVMPVEEFMMMMAMMSPMGMPGADTEVEISEDEALDGEDESVELVEELNEE